MPKQIFSAGLAVSTALALTLSLSACSGESSANIAIESTGAPAPEESADPFPEDTLVGYFTPLGAAAPAEKATALDFAASGSVAAMYVTEQVAHAQAQQDGGFLVPETEEIVIEEESVLLCTDGHDAEGAEKDDFCSKFSNFVFDENDKIVSFNAGEKPLEGRIALGDGTEVAISDVGTVTYLSSYITIGGHLVVVLEVASNVDPLRIMSYEATYVAENGRPSTATTSEGPLELKSDRLSNVAIAFPNVGLGGTLELDFMDADYNNYSIEIPTSK